MKFLEKDLEQIIYDSYKEDFGKELEARGLDINGFIKRQLNIGKYGFCDLITIERLDNGYFDIDRLDENNKELFSFINDKKLKITVFELKKDKIGISAFLQSIKYAKGVIDFFNKKGCNNIDVHITLIGKKLDTSGSFCFIPNIFNNVKFYTYKYDFNGILFEEHKNYSLKNKGF